MHPEPGWRCDNPHSGFVTANLLNIFPYNESCVMNSPRRRLTTLLAASLAIFISLTAAASPGKLRRRPTGVVSGEYIVVLRSDIPTDGLEGVARSIAAAYGGTAAEVWSDTIKGFFCLIPDEAAGALAADPRVRYVEQNVRVDAPLSATVPSTVNGEYLWHLDRIDEPSWAGRDQTYNMCTEGRTVTIFILDTSVQRSHPEFASSSRVATPLDFSSDRSNLSVPYTNDVTDGCTTSQYLNSSLARSLWHGTAIASVAAGERIGASRARVYPLKVINCKQEWDYRSLINAVNAIPRLAYDEKRSGISIGVVINHSGYLPTWKDGWLAYEEAIASYEYPFITSADNFSTDACTFSPNGLAYTKTNKANRSVFVVGGTSVADWTGAGGSTVDSRWLMPSSLTAEGSGSNSGQCVSAWAPAADIYHAQSNNSYWVEMNDWQWYGRHSGTSFSAPLIAAMAARYMEMSYRATGIVPKRTEIYEWLLQRSTGPVGNTTTAAYWICHTGTNPAQTWWANPPAICGSGRVGQPVTNAPFYYPSVGNSANAGMFTWDEGACY